ncbi:MAG: hypothetical protein QXI38_02550, partial [Conexivisphaerales archaeon]
TFIPVRLIRSLISSSFLALDVLSTILICLGSVSQVIVKLVQWRKPIHHFLSKEVREFKLETILIYNYMYPVLDKYLDSLCLMSDLISLERSFQYKP